MTKAVFTIWKSDISPFSDSTVDSAADQPADKIIIGNEEWCAFPRMGIPAIKARIDSGANTSSINASSIKRFRRQQQSWLRFDVYPLQNNKHTRISCEAPLLEKRTVKNSFGIREKRYVIKAALQVGLNPAIMISNVEVTLAKRDSMGYKMLLGRQAMQGRFLIDPSLQCCLGNMAPAEEDELYVRKTQID